MAWSSAAYSERICSLLASFWLRSCVSWSRSLVCLPWIINVTRGPSAPITPATSTVHISAITTLAKRQNKSASIHYSQYTRPLLNRLTRCHNATCFLHLSILAGIIAASYRSFDTKPGGNRWQKCNFRGQRGVGIQVSWAHLTYRHARAAVRKIFRHGFLTVLIAWSRLMVSGRWNRNNLFAPIPAKTWACSYN